MIYLILNPGSYLDPNFSAPDTAFRVVAGRWGRCPPAGVGAPDPARPSAARATPHPHRVLVRFLLRQSSHDRRPDGAADGKRSA